MRFSLGLALFAASTLGRAALPSSPGADFAVTWPAALGSAEPLASIGAVGSGDLVLVGRDGAGDLRFGWDHARSGALWGAPAKDSPRASHAVQVSFEARDGTAGIPGEETALKYVCVLLDGRVAYFAHGPIFRPVAGDPAIGVNRSGLPGAARQFFLGSVTGIRRFDSTRPETSWRQACRWYPDLNPGGFLPVGALRVRLELPRDRTGQAEPLIVTGVTGKADTLFLRYVDATHIVLGMDHWGVGAAASAPIAIDYARPHTFAIDLASFHGPGSAVPTTVALDGRTVFTPGLGVHPTRGEEIVVGTNDVGSSTCEPRFTGLIVAVGPQGD